VNAAADANVTNTLNGNFLSAGNPYFQGLIKQVGQAIQPSIDGQFAASGRYGSGANANAFASALSNTAGQLAYQNYGDERSNQIKDTALAPGTANQDYTDISQLGAAGQNQRSLLQDYVNQDINRFGFNQQAPTLNLQQYLAGIGGPILGSSSVTSTPIYGQPGSGSSTGGTVGGILGGIAGAYFGGPGGAMAGGALGSSVGNSIFG
jgi:hypothetical protein